MSAVGPENPNPGSDGITTWKASPGSPPCAAGSVSGPTSSWNSTIDPGHPWISSSGVASASGDRTWMKCSSAPSIVVVNCGSWFSRSSCVRQS